MIEQLHAAAARAETDPIGALTAHPWLGEAIERDAAAGRIDRWGRSTAVDELTGTAVLVPALVEALHARAGIAAQWPVGNAGLLHIYGYLLSTMPTPFGLKRERWIGGGLARAYGLPGDAFHPWSSPRTLLDRVSEAAEGLLAHGVVRRAPLAGTGAEASLALGRAGDSGPTALVLAVDGMLVTTFPVASPETILAEWDADPGRLRWNAVAP